MPELDAGHLLPNMDKHLATVALASFKQCLGQNLVQYGTILDVVSGTRVITNGLGFSCNPADRLIPAYVDRKVPTKMDLERLGCGAALQDYMLMGPLKDRVLVHPADWFWTDRNWFSNASEHLMQEIYLIAGGQFNLLPVKQQTAMLALPFSVIPGTPAAGMRGCWTSKVGSAVSVEEFALESFSKASAPGLFSGALPIKTLSLMVSKEYEKITGKFLGFESSDVRTPPSEDYASKVVLCLEPLVANIEKAYAKYVEYLLWVMKTDKISQVIDYVKIVGPDMLSKIYRHSYRYGLTYTKGHPDLTIRHAGMPKFVEVKAKDRMLGSQGIWVRDIARPLALDLSVIQVSRK